MPVPKFPYEYTPEHPFLHKKQAMTISRFLGLCLCYITAPILILPKAIFVMAVSISCDIILKVIIYLSQHFYAPMINISYPIYRFFWYLMLKGQFITIKVKGKRDLSAPILISNHTNMNDVVTHGVLNAPTYLARSDMFEAFLVGPVITANGSLAVDKLSSNKELIEKMKEICNDYSTTSHPLQIFPEGTIAAEHVILRFRPGAFILNEKIQPVCIVYRKFLPMAWLCESGLRHLIDQGGNFCTLLEYKYLEVHEGESPDECGKRLATAMHREYVPYNNVDYLYFSGKISEKEKCSQEYLNDFGWMGQIDKWKEMCKQNGLNWRYFHDRQEFKAVPYE